MKSICYLVLFLLLLLLKFFGVKFIEKPMVDLFLLIILSFLSLFYVNGRVKDSYTKLIKLYVFFVFCSCLYSNYYHNQSLLSTLTGSYMFFSLLFYFFLLSSNLSFKQIESVLKIVAILFCSCYILQWLIYPVVLFNSAADQINITGDQFRMRMPGSICCYFLFVYGVCKYILCKKTKYLLYTLCGFIPIIVQGFRSLVVLSIVSIPLVLFFTLRKVSRTLLYGAFFSVVAMVVLNNQFVVQKIDEMEERNNSDQTFSNTDYIRYLSLDYYWNEQFTNPYEKFWGGGYPIDNTTNYYKRITTVKRSYNYFWEDLGVVGLSFIIGLPATLLLITMYVICMWRCKEPELQYIRFTLFIVLIGSLFTSMELFRKGNILLLSLFLYIEYKYHQELRQKKKIIINDNC